MENKHVEAAMQVEIATEWLQTYFDAEVMRTNRRMGNGAVLCASMAEVHDGLPAPVGFGVGVIVDQDKTADPLYSVYVGDLTSDLKHELFHQTGDNWQELVQEALSYLDYLRTGEL